MSHSTKGRTPSTAGSESASVTHRQLELKKWSETFEEAVRILTRIVPYPSAYVRNSDDERSILLELCNQIADVAEHPEETEQYKSLAGRLQTSEIRVAELDRKAEELSQNVQKFISKPYSPRSPKMGLTDKLDRVESILRSQIKQQRRSIGQFSRDQSMSTNVSFDPRSVSDGASGSEVYADVRDEESPTQPVRRADLEKGLRELPHSKKVAASTRATRHSALSRRNRVVHS
jgi:hypothetical protein